MTPTCSLTESKLACGSKLQHKVNLGAWKEFFLEGQNHNFSKLRGSKV